MSTFTFLQVADGVRISEGRIDAPSRYMAARTLADRLRRRSAGLVEVSIDHLNIVRAADVAYIPGCSLCGGSLLIYGAEGTDCWWGHPAE